MHSTTHRHHGRLPADAAVPVIALVVRPGRALGQLRAFERRQPLVLARYEGAAEDEGAAQAQILKVVLCPCVWIWDVVSAASFDRQLTLTVGLLWPTHPPPSNGRIRPTTCLLSSVSPVDHRMRQHIAHDRA